MDGVNSGDNNKWCVDFNSNNPPYIIIKASKIMSMTGYSLTTGNDTGSQSGRNWKDWTIYGANFSSDSEATAESEKWQVVTSVTNDAQLQAANYTTSTYNLESEAAPYQYYKIVITANHSGSLIQMSEFSMTGTSYEKLDLTKSDNCYTFTMPENDVIFKAAFRGTVYFVKKDKNGKWTAKTDLEKANFDGTTFEVTSDIANKYSTDHYAFKGYSTAYSGAGKYTKASVGKTINTTAKNGAIYLYYELESYALKLYQDIAGTQIYKTVSLPYDSPLSGYANEQPAAQDHDTFAGWSVDKNQSSYDVTKLVDWSNLNMTEAMDVYPIWVHDKVNVKMEAGYENAQGIDPGFVELGGTITTPNITRDGYTLEGWYTQKGTKWDGTWNVTPEYCDKNEDGSDYVQTDSDKKYDYYTLTLTAHWTPKTAAVVYALGDHAKSGSTAPANGSVTMGGIITLDSAVNLADDDYLFTGWKDGKDNLYSAGGNLALSDWSIVDNDKIMLTAQYVHKPTVKLCFDTDGGSPIEPFTQNVGTKISLSDYITTRTGYSFNKWTDGTVNYSLADDYTVPDSGTDYVTLKADWTINQYTITFDSLGGTAVSSITQNYGTTVIAPENPTREHYTFKGWYPELPTAMPAENITLTAIWEPTTYTVTFKNDSTTHATQTGIYGAEVTSPSAPTKAEAVFDGWRDSSDETVTFPTYIWDDVTYTAAWRQAVSHPVTFKVVNGKWDDNTAEDKTITLTGYEGDELKLLADQIPSAGMYPDNTFETGSWDVIPDTEITINEEKTYTYSYKQKDRISATVTFKVTGGEWDDGTPNDKIVELSGYEGDELKLSADQIPSAGTKPDSKHSVGSWDEIPSTDVEITENITYIYVYEANKEEADVTTIPTAKTGLIYNKSAQLLLNNDGVADGGELQYALGDENGASQNYTTSIPTGTNVGSYYVWYKAIADTDHVDSGEYCLEVTIDKADITPTVSITGWTYGETANTPSVTGNTGDGTVTYSYAVKDSAEYTETVPTSAGNYTVKAVIAETDNYNAATVTKDFSISKAATNTVTVSINGWTYGEGANTPTAAATFGIPAFTYSDTVDGAYTSAVPAKAGNHYVKATVEDTDNYSGGESDPVMFTIAKKSVELTWGTSDFTYDGTEKIPAASIKSGILESDTCSVEVSGAHTDVNAGTETYNATASLTGKDAGNYEIVEADRTKAFTIKAKSVKVSGITAGNKEYDGTMTAAVSTANAVFDGIVDGDTLTVTATGAFEDTNAGEGKTVNISGLALGGASVGNYKLATTGNQTTATADISKKAVMVTPDADQSKTYGVADPTFTYTAAGLVGEEKLSGVLARAIGEKVGKYAYTIGTLDSENPNYSVSIAENAPKFVIRKAALTVTADAKNITYGDEDVTLTYKVTGLIEGDTAESVITGELTREVGTDAGTYKITQGSLTSDDYVITFVGADYVIAKASQAAPAESFTQSKASGNDTADGKISGFAETKVYQLSSDNGTTWADVEAERTSLDVKAGTYQIRYAADKNHEAGVSVSVTVEKKAEQDAPEGLMVVNVSEEDAADGSVAGVTDAMEYSTDGGDSWISVAANADKIEGLSKGKVKVRYAATDDKNAGPATEVVIGVASNTEGVVEFRKEEESTPDGTTPEKAVTGVDNETTKASVEDFAETQQEEGKDVKVALEITSQKEENVDNTSVEETNKIVEEVFAGIDSSKIVTEYLSIDVAKYVDNVKETENISDTKSPLEIALKYDSTKSNPIVIRTHDGRAKAFGKLRSRPVKSDYKDAVFYVDIENAILYIYSQFFSDFAIVYATETTYNVGFVSGTDSNLSSLVVVEGGKITLPTGLTREGYVFDGWYKDEAFESEWKEDDTVNSDITLYAKWNKSVSGVSVSPSEIKFTKAGETSQLKVTVTPADAANTKVTYKSSNPKAVTVDADGKITAVANGTAAITVTTEDGAKTATVKVTVAIPEVKQQGTEEPVQQPTKEEKAVISMNAGLKISQTGSKINIKWGKVKEADGYDVYVTYCGMKFNIEKPVKSLEGYTNNSATVTKINGRKINLKKNYKVYVAAHKMVDGRKEVLAKTITGHVVGRLNTKYSNAKKITLSKNKYSVKAGKTVKVKAKTVLVDKSKKQLSDDHAAEFRYASANKNIATVDKNGKIKGVAAGTTTVYVYARNGYAKKVKVTVK